MSRIKVTHSEVHKFGSNRLIVKITNEMLRDIDNTVKFYISIIRNRLSKIRGRIRNVTIQTDYEGNDFEKNTVSLLLTFTLIKKPRFIK